MEESSDSRLSLVANWISIVTFITITLNGLGMFYIFYKLYKKTEEDLVAYEKALKESSESLAFINFGQP